MNSPTRSSMPGTPRCGTKIPTNPFFLVLRLFGPETALFDKISILTDVESVQRQLLMQTLGFRSQRGVALGRREGDERGSWHEMLFHEMPPSVTLRKIQSTGPRRQML
jgi:hypothetical protein